MKPFDHRMPAILAPEHYEVWLEHDTHEARLLAMLTPFPADRMEVVRLTPLVNNVKNDGPECLTPAARATTALPGSADDHVVGGRAAVRAIRVYHRRAARGERLAVEGLKRFGTNVATSTQGWFFNAGLVH